MVASLFEEIEKIFTGDKLEEEKQERTGLEGTMKSDDVGMCREGLMNRSLSKLQHSTSVVHRIYAHLPRIAVL